MKLVIKDLDNFDFLHIYDLIDCLKNIEHKVGTENSLEVRYEKEFIKYNIVHKKKGFIVSSERFDIKENIMKNIEWIKANE